MPLHECPGPDRKKPLAPEIIECPNCGKELEIWTDESMAWCPVCSEKISRTSRVDNPS